MRWPHRRPQPAATTAASPRGAAVAAEPAAPITTAPGSPSPAGEGPPHPRKEWALVPGLRPVVSEPPMVVPSRAFYQSVHGAQSLLHRPPMLAGTQRRDLEAPVGIVHGLATSRGGGDGVELGPVTAPRSAGRGTAAASGGVEGAGAPSGRGVSAASGRVASNTGFEVQPLEDEPLEVAPAAVAFTPMVPSLPVVAAAPPPSLVAVTPLMTTDLVLPPRSLTPSGSREAATEAPPSPHGARIPPVSPQMGAELPPSPPGDTDGDAGRPAAAPGRPSVGRTRRTGLGAPVLFHTPGERPASEAEPSKPALARAASPAPTSPPPPGGDAVAEPDAVPPPPAPDSPVAATMTSSEEGAPPRIPPSLRRRRSRLGAPIDPLDLAPAPTPKALPAPPGTPAREAPLPDPRRRVEAVPPAVRDVVLGRTGADVGDVLVHRDERAAREAREQGARAFTRDGVVSLPEEHGPLTGGGAVPLLAHELTHVVQQRRFGTSLPLEHTPLGRRLEHEARSTERAVSGQPDPSPPPVPAPPVGAVQATPEAAAGDFVVGDAVAEYRRALGELEAAGAHIGEDGSVWLASEFEPPRTTGAGLQRAGLDEAPINPSAFVPVPGSPGLHDSEPLPGTAIAAAGGGATSDSSGPADGVPVSDHQIAIPPAASPTVSEFQPLATSGTGTGPPTPGGASRSADMDSSETGPFGDFVFPPQGHPPLSGDGLDLSMSGPDLHLEVVQMAAAALSGAAAGTGTAPASGGAASGEVHHHHHHDIDEEALFRNFYSRMRRRLQRDMLIERERAGAVTNSH